MRSIAVELTSICNQKCTYCYNAWREDGGAAMGELSKEKLVHLLDKVLDETPLEHLTLTGGEPFTRRDIHEIIDFINARGKGVSIISNGGLIRDETADRLAKQHIHYIQITLAGSDRETHDAIAGKGSFDRICAAFERLTARGVPTAGSYLCTKENAHQASAVFERFASWNVCHVAFNRFNPSGFSVAAMDRLMPTRGQVVEALDAANAAAGQFGVNTVCTMPIPPCVVDYGMYPHISFGNCSAGHAGGELAIGPDGKVRLCTLQAEGIGNALDTPLEELLRSQAAASYRENIPDFCVGCPHASTCLGGCGAAAEWVLGMPDDLDPFVAQHVMEDFEERVAAKVRGVQSAGPLAIEEEELKMNWGPSL